MSSCWNKRIEEGKVEGVPKMLDSVSESAEVWSGRCAGCKSWAHLGSDANMPKGGDRVCLLGKLQAEAIVQFSSSYSYENTTEADLTPGPA